MSKWTELKERPANTLRRARQRVGRVRHDGQDRIWKLSTSTLERVDGWLDAADELPALGRIAGAAGKLVNRRLEHLTEVPVDGWNDLNAKKAIAAVKDLDRAGLRSARHREASTKERKTVLAAIDRRLGHEVVQAA